MFEKIFAFINYCEYEIIKIYKVQEITNIFGLSGSFVFVIVCCYFIINYRGFKKR